MRALGISLSLSRESKSPLTPDDGGESTLSSPPALTGLLRSTGPLVIGLSAAALMSWSGLYKFGTHEMGWSDFYSLLIPLALDMFAIAAVEYAFRQIEDGESGIQFRLIAACLVGMSTFINWRGALRTGNVGEELFFPSMSVIVFWTANALMGARRRKVRRAQHGHKAKMRVEPLPRYGLLEWLLYPRSTVRELRGAVGERRSRSHSHFSSRPKSPQVVRSQVVSQAASHSHSQTSSQPSSQPQPPVSGERITANSQTEAIRKAIDAVGTNAADVVGYLAEHGWPDVPKQRVYTTLGRMPKGDRLRLIETEATG